MRQASSQTQALDAAVATVQILISSYHGYGSRPGQGHKHALQAIRLLASVSKRFDEAIDLFFDLVERFCAQSHGQGKPDSFAARMMQNYDQTLVKLISRQWSKGRRATQWNVETPIERIKTLRQIYDFRDNMSIRSVRTFTKRQPSSILFSESLQVLRSIQKRATERVLAMWIKNIATQMRSWSKKEPKFDPTVSTLSTSSTLAETAPISPVSVESRRKLTPRDAEIIDLKQQVDMLCAVIENNAHSKCKLLLTSEWNLKLTSFQVYHPKLSDVETASSYTFADDARSMRSYRTGRTKEMQVT